MQAVILGMFGISELQRRNASPVHICRASAVSAKLWLDDNAETEAVKASTKPAWRSLLMKDAVMFGSHWHREAGPFLMRATMRRMPLCHREDRHDSQQACDLRHNDISGRIRRPQSAC